MSDWEPVIGLEIHVQLVDADEDVLRLRALVRRRAERAHLPDLPRPPRARCRWSTSRRSATRSRSASRSGVRSRSTRSFTARTTSIPTIRRRYQISQYDSPLCVGGRLGDVRIHRVHLEEDAAKLVHESASGRIHGSETSAVDFNRGGTPLVEIVTEPDLHDGATAREWLGLLRTTIRQLGVSDVNMDEGSLRCDANISLRPAGSTELGTKTELKNMNSFRFVERGIAAEIERQTAILDGGGTVEQETLHFDPRSGELTPLRSKEYSHDYRYFPEPDLVPLAPTEEMLADARAALPELPAERRERYAGLGLGRRAGDPARVRLRAG